MNARPVGTEYAAAIPGGPTLGPVSAPDVVAAYRAAQARWPEVADELGVAPGAAGQALLQGSLLFKLVEESR